MKNRNLYNALIIISVIIFSFIYQFVLLDKILMYIEYITTSFFIVITFVAFLFFGFRKEKDNILKKHINKSIIMYVITYFSSVYFIGLILGFLKNSYSLRFATLMSNILAPFITIVSIEIFRYIMIRANKDKKYFHIIISLVIALAEIAYSVRFSNIVDFVTFFEISTSVILPVTFKNLFLGFLSYQVGYKSCLLYRLFIELYIYVAPIMPDLGKYLTSIIGISVPVLLYNYFSKTIDEYYNGVEYEFATKQPIGVGLAKASVLVLVAGLVYGFLPYYILGIASDSMSPYIDKGDAVILHKTKNEKKYKKGDVIAFNHNDRVIVHRLVDIVDENNETYYITKGDANTTPDNYQLKFDNIVGEVKLVIPFLGYPSVYLSDYLAAKE